MIIFPFHDLPRCFAHRGNIYSGQRRMDILVIWDVVDHLRLWHPESLTLLHESNSKLWRSWLQWISKQHIESEYLLP